METISFLFMNHGLVVFGSFVFRNHIVENSGLLNERSCLLNIVFLEIYVGSIAYVQVCWQGDSQSTSTNALGLFNDV